MGLVDRLKASYERLAKRDGEPVPVRVNKKPIKLCKLCETPAFTRGLCPEHAIDEGKAIALARKRAWRSARRKQFALARRAARQAGDWQLWHEIGWQRRNGREIPTDTGPDAPWRERWPNKKDRT